MNGFIAIYERATMSEYFGHLNSFFQGHGLSLANPLTGAVSVWSERGDRDERSEQWIVDALRQGQSISIQWWLTEALDLFCQMRRVDGGMVAELALDGHTEDELPDILRLVFEALQGSSSAFGLVVDADYVTEGFDWSKFFTGRAPCPEHLPDLLGISPDKRSTLGKQTWPSRLVAPSILAFAITSRGRRWLASVAQDASPR